MTRTMKRLTRPLALLALAGVTPLTLAQPVADQIGSEPIAIERDAERPLIQLALLLDTSGSMDGLIEQAKTQLWAIVNELATSKRDGSPPILEVALYEYGKQTIPLQENQLRQILPLTSDLDAVSQALFALSTNGGEEYCGAVIESAARGLKWSEDRSVLKMIVIAGNEPFTQGGVDYRQSVPEAIARGVIVNTIHCGDRQTGIDSGWADGARLGDGEYSFIDHNADLAPIATPHDNELIRLSAELNSTYLAFGAHAAEGLARQTQADASAEAASPPAAASRAQAKAGALYRNALWDLVDAVAEEQVELGELEADQLPEEMRDMDEKERVLYVEGKAEERVALQQQIQELSQARDAYVAAERAKGAQGETLESALLRAIRAQGERIGLAFQSDD